MKKSELKQLIRETIEEYKSNDPTFWQGAADKAYYAALRKGGKGLADRLGRFEKYATDAHLRSTQKSGSNSVKKFKIMLGREGADFNGEVEIINITKSATGSVKISFKKENESDASRSQYIYIASNEDFKKNRKLGAVLTSDNKKYEISNDMTSGVRFDRVGAIILSKLSGIPVSEIPMI